LSFQTQKTSRPVAVCQAGKAEEIGKHPLSGSESGLYQQTLDGTKCVFKKSLDQLGRLQVFPMEKTGTVFGARNAIIHYSSVEE